MVVKIRDENGTGGVLTHCVHEYIPMHMLKEQTMGGRFVKKRDFCKAGLPKTVLRLAQECNGFMSSQFQSTGEGHR